MQWTALPRSITSTVMLSSSNTMLNPQKILDQLRDGKENHASSWSSRPNDVKCRVNTFVNPGKPEVNIKTSGVQGCNKGNKGWVGNTSGIPASHAPKTLKSESTVMRLQIVAFGVPLNGKFVLMCLPIKLVYQTHGRFWNVSKYCQDTIQSNTLHNRKACSYPWGQQLQRCLAMTVHTLHLSVKDELKGSGTPLQATPGRFGIRWHSWIMTAMKCGYQFEMKASESWRLQISEQNFQNEESLDVLRLLPSHKMTSSQSPIEITLRQRISQTALLCNCASLTCPWGLTITCHPVLAIQWSQIIDPFQNGSWKIATP